MVPAVVARAALVLPRWDRVERQGWGHGMEPTKGKPLGRYGRSVGLVALSIVLVLGMIVAIVGPRQVATSLMQLRSLDQARAGNLAGLASATGRDQRFGIAEGYK